MPGANRFPKSFRLSGHTAPDRLFDSGQILKVWPLRIVYKQMPMQGTTPLAKVLISVPKRQVKLATNRNRVRRRLRDAYRLSLRARLLPAVLASGQDVHIALVYIAGATKIDAGELQKKLNQALERLSKELGRAAPASLPPSGVLS